MLKQIYNEWGERSDGQKKGFTLLELLIVIAVIAVLAVILVLVLNPAETLQQSRDTQRMSDLSSLKTAIGLYSTTQATPYFAGAASNAACTNAGAYGAGDLIYYSYPSNAPGAAITDTLLDGSIVASQPAANQVTNANLNLVNGSGWLPINLGVITGGSPLSNLPVDPTNSVTAAAVVNTDLAYRYACDDNSGILTYEIDAVLESTQYTSTDNKMTKDGGNNSNYYEVGTDLTVLGTGTDF